MGSQAYIFITTVSKAWLYKLILLFVLYSGHWGFGSAATSSIIGPSLWDYGDH